MERLTKQEPIGNFPYQLKDNEVCTKLDSIHKLGQLEDIEEELGIDLTILLKGVQSLIDFIRKFGVSRIWYFNEEKLEKADLKNLDYNKDLLHLSTNDGYYTRRKISDYGKTWALTKEELEAIYGC